MAKGKLQGKKQAGPSTKKPAKKPDNEALTVAPTSVAATTSQDSTVLLAQEVALETSQPEISVAILIPSPPHNHETSPSRSPPTLSSTLQQELQKPTPDNILTTEASVESKPPLKRSFSDMNTAQSIFDQPTSSKKLAVDKKVVQSQNNPLSVNLGAYSKEKTSREDKSDSAPHIEHTNAQTPAYSCEHNDLAKRQSEAPVESGSAPEGARIVRPTGFGNVGLSDTSRDTIVTANQESDSVKQFVYLIRTTEEKIAIDLLNQTMEDLCNDNTNRAQLARDILQQLFKDLAQRLEGVPRECKDDFTIIKGSPREQRTQLERTDAQRVVMEALIGEQAFIDWFEESWKLACSREIVKYFAKTTTEEEFWRKLRRVHSAIAWRLLNPRRGVSKILAITAGDVRNAANITDDHVLNGGVLPQDKHIYMINSGLENSSTLAEASVWLDVRGYLRWTTRDITRYTSGLFKDTGLEGSLGRSEPCIKEVESPIILDSKNAECQDTQVSESI